jgi:hypothetical protein
MKTDTGAGILTILMLLWIVYALLIGVRLVALGATGSLSWPFSWRELEIAGGLAIASAVVAFFTWIHDWE